MSGVGLRSDFLLADKYFSKKVIARQGGYASIILVSLRI